MLTDWVTISVMDDHSNSKNDKKTSDSSKDWKAFDQTMRGLVKVPKTELDEEERKYQRRKRARSPRRHA